MRDRIARTVQVSVVRYSLEVVRPKLRWASLRCNAQVVPPARSLGRKSQRQLLRPSRRRRLANVQPLHGLSDLVHGRQHLTVPRAELTRALDVLEKYLAYLRNIVDNAKGGAVQPLYSVMGDPELHEFEAVSLAGYRGNGPVRIGNAAYKQVQFDCYGQIVMPTAQAFFDTRLLRMADEREQLTC